MGDLRFEAWDLPTAGTFTRKIADIPVVHGTGAGYKVDGDGGQGQLSVPADYSRLSDIIASDEGSLIRVYDGTTLIHEWLALRVRHDVAETGLVQISGPDVQYALQSGIVYPYDYPTNPSVDSDWRWGSNSNLVSNGGFETGILVANDGFEDGTISPWWAGRVDGVSATLAISTANADAGTYHARCTPLLSEGGMSTNLTGLYESKDYTVTARVDGTAGKTIQIGFSGPSTMGVGSGDQLIAVETPQHTHEVNKDWTASGVYETMSFYFTAGLGQTSSQLSIRDASGTPAVFDVDSVSVTGYGVGMEPWEPTSVSDVTAFETDSTYTYALSSYSGKVTAGNGHGAKQTISNVIPGATYTAEVWVRNLSGSARWVLELQDNNGNVVAQDDVATSTTWQQLQATGTIPTSARWLVLYLYNYSGASATAYFDAADVFQGQPAATVGDILIDLFDDATSNHSADTRGTVLDWVDYTGFTASVDTDGGSWADNLVFTAHVSDTYLNILRTFRRMGFFWTLTPKGSPSAGDTHELNVYEPENGIAGTDYSSADTPSITFGAGTISGTVVERMPSFTAVLVGGENGMYGEVEDATAESNFGRWEAGRQNTSLGSSNDLAAYGTEVLREEADDLTSIQVGIVRDANHPVPLVDYTVGDVLNVQIPPLVAKAGLMVSRIAYQNSEPAVYEVQVREYSAGLGGE